MTYTYEGPIHLKPIEQSTVDALCDRAAAMANCEYAIIMEIRGFRRDRTPHDAMRLANALVIFRRGDDALIRDLDSLAYERAQLMPAFRPQLARGEQ